MNNIRSKYKQYVASIESNIKNCLSLLGRVKKTKNPKLLTGFVVVLPEDDEFTEMQMLNSMKCPYTSKSPCIT